MRCKLYFRTLLMAVLLFVVSMPVTAGEIDRYKIAFATSTTLLAADWLQTRYIADHPDEYYEKWNFILRGHPRKRDVDIYFASVMVGNYLAYKYLPKDLDFWANIVLSSVELSAVSNNLKIGIGFGF